jgi:rod shape-determining protein MreC
MELLAQHRRKFLLGGIGICVIAIVLTIAPGAPNIVSRGVASVITPLQRGLNSAAGFVSGHMSAFFRGAQLLEENARLAQLVEELTLTNARLQLAADESAALFHVLDMQERYSQLPTVGARVIGGVDGWYRELWIDRGERDGVGDGMPVFGGGGLVGVTRYTINNRSSVILLTDSRFSAAVSATRTGDIGTVSGCLTLMHDGMLRLAHFAEDAMIIAGDEIVTAAHSLIFPPGLVIGTVREVRTNPDGMTRYATVLPAADLQISDVVLVAILGQ